MPSVFEALPGIEVPVGEIKPSLTRMWESPDAPSRQAQAESARAMQMNYVLHFGFATEADDAVKQFETIKAFSQRYPCRVVVLCPLTAEATASEMRAKVYGECFLGKSKDDTRCVEFVVLSYPMSSRRFLENQVSICLSTDLPTYYWAHRFSDSARLADYNFLLSHAKRVVFDTAIVSADAVSYPWPRPDAIRDLVHARLLPVRQSLGQFLSGFEPAKLVDGLQAVKLYHRERYAPEARVLLEWFQRRLTACGLSEDCASAVRPSAAKGIDDFAVEFLYNDDRYFKWRADLTANHAEFGADLGQGGVDLTTAMHLLEPAAALSEATFF
jgi:glucose-6-phosphate dehydrogenase assembly protein OpcA